VAAKEGGAGHAHEHGDKEAARTGHVRYSPPQPGGGGCRMDARVPERHRQGERQRHPDVEG
jgi:hypothetical protein